MEGNKNSISREQRRAELLKELNSLKCELKHTRGGWKRLWLNDEIRSVAAQLARYTD